MIVFADINNLPTDIDRSENVGKYIVVRRCEDEDQVSLWYYGIYSEKQNAMNVAQEIGNGFVVKIV